MCHGDLSVQGSVAEASASTRGLTKVFAALGLHEVLLELTQDSAVQSPKINDNFCDSFNDC